MLFVAWHGSDHHSNSYHIITVYSLFSTIDNYKYNDMLLSIAKYKVLSAVLLVREFPSGHAEVIVQHYPNNA